MAQEDRQPAAADSTLVTIDLRAALAAVALVLKLGQRTHAADDWKNHDSAWHCDRALKHLHAFEDGDDDEPHLSHACVRLLFALQLESEREG